MALQINVAGKITGIPGVYLDAIVLASGVRQSTFQETGVVLIVGPCDGPIKPHTPVEFYTDRSLSDFLGEGEAYDAARAAFNPSRDDPNEVRGAQRVIVVRANSAVQASDIIYETAPATGPLLDVLSVAYGLKANRISHKLEAGTSGGPGKKYTVKEIGKTDEVGDDLGFQPIFLIRYTGDGACTMTINETQLATTVAGSTDGSVSFTAPFSTYKNITDLVQFINTQSKFEAVAIVSNGQTFKTVDLDYVTGVDIKTETGDLAFANDTTETFTGTLAVAGTLDDGDVVYVEDTKEYIWIKDAANDLGLRGYVNSTPATAAGSNAWSYWGATAVNAAIRDWANLQSSRVLLTRNAANTAGVPALFSETFLLGGSEGSTALVDWRNALKAVRKTPYNYGTVTSNDLTVHTELASHATEKWGLLSQPAGYHVGTADNLSENAVISHIKSIADMNISVWWQGVGYNNDLNVDTQYPPYMLAAMACGIQAGTPVGTPLTDKALRINNLYYNSSIDLVDRLEFLIKARACTVWNDGTEFKIVRALTSWLQDEQQRHIAPNVRAAMQMVTKKVLGRVRAEVLGNRVASGDALGIKLLAEDTLDEIRDVDGWIIEGARRTPTGQREVIPAYQKVTVEKTGNLTDLQFEYTPVEGNDFVRVKQGIHGYQDVA